MKKKIKRMILVSGAVCMLSMTMTACGSGAGTDASQENAEDSLQAPEADTETDPAQASETEPDQNPTAYDAEQNSKDAGTADNTGSGKWHVLDAEIARLVDADFEGTVWKIEQDSFFVAEATNELLDNGALISSSPSPESDVAESDLLQVVYDNNTRFYVRAIYDNGARYEDTEATSGHLEQYASVALKGTIKDDIFYADEVRISK